MPAASLLILAEPGSLENEPEILAVLRAREFEVSLRADWKAALEEAASGDEPLILVVDERLIRGAPRDLGPGVRFLRAYVAVLERRRAALVLLNPTCEERRQAREQGGRYTGGSGLVTAYIFRPVDPTVLLQFVDRIINDGLLGPTRR